MSKINEKPDVDVEFLDRVDLELKRAKRYRLFVSLMALDLSQLRETGNGPGFGSLSDLLQVVQDNVRIMDNVTMLGDKNLVLLLPETSRQGAQIAARRLTDLIRTSLQAMIGEAVDPTIPLEMASFPDAAGTKSITDFRQELSRQNMK
ncbi:MAG: hypothetical protein ABII79_07685 [bacterium]